MGLDVNLYAEGAEPVVTTCRSRSKYGRCGRPQRHEGQHAVPVGDDVWFGYTRSSAIGYGNCAGQGHAKALDEDPS